MDATICYSIKSCGNLTICKLLVAEGCGMDVTTGGELFARLGRLRPEEDHLRRRGKTDQEIVAGINAAIAAFNLESEAEIENIDRVAASIGKTAIGAIRINRTSTLARKTHAKTTTGKR